MQRISYILDFWFSQDPRIWFWGRTEEFDTLVREKFLSDYEDTIAGKMMLGVIVPKEYSVSFSSSINFLEICSAMMLRLFLGILKRSISQNLLSKSIISTAYQSIMLCFWLCHSCTLKVFQIKSSASSF